MLLCLTAGSNNWRSTPYTVPYRTTYTLYRVPMIAGSTAVTLAFYNPHEVMCAVFL